MRVIVRKREVRILDQGLPVEGEFECEASVEGDILKISLPHEEIQRESVKRALEYLERPDSECDIKTMCSALEVDID